MASDLNSKTNKNQTTSDKPNKKLIIATIIVLSVLLLGSVGYIVKLTLDKEEQKTEISKISDEKQEIISDLELLKETCDKAMVENTEMSQELESERTKIVQLLEEVKDAQSSLTLYKERYRKLERKLVALTKENEQLRRQNAILRQEIDSTKSVLFTEIEHSQELSGKNQQLTKTIEDAAQLAISNIEATFVQIKKSGKEVKVKKAKKANRLKINYTVAQNKIAPKGSKSYYLQVINNRMNVLSQSGTADFGSQSLAYTLVSTFDYDNTTLKVSEQIKVDKLEKGLYFVNIFDQDKMIATRRFTLE